MCNYEILFILLKLFISRTDYFICQSKYGILDFKKNFNPGEKTRIKLIYNGINIKKAKRLSTKKISKTDQILFDKDLIKIISVGRFSHQKDFFTLIRAFKLVNNKLPKTRLFLIGDGELRLEIQMFIKKMELKNSVFLLGWKKNVFPYLSQSNLFVFSSKYEGFPFSLIEAMTQKLPIISTDTKFGPREILDNERFGILVSVGDYQQMANKIIELIENRSLLYKYSNLSYQRVNYFSESKMMNNYRNFLLEIYKSL